MTWAKMETMKNKWDKILEKKINTFFSSQLSKILKISAKDPRKFLKKTYKIIDKDNKELNVVFISVYTEIINYFGKYFYNELLKDKFKAFSVFKFGILSWIKKIIFPQTKKIDKTTKKTIKKIVEEGMKDGLTVVQIKNELKDKLPQMNEKRAKRIARTEVNSAANKGSFEGAKQTGLTLKKEWLSTMDRRTRQTHMAANGQIVGLNAKFLVGGEFMDYPGDPSASYKNVVNCRCAITYYE